MTGPLFSFILFACNIEPIESPIVAAARKPKKQAVSLPEGVRKVLVQKLGMSEPYLDGLEFKKMSGGTAYIVSDPTALTCFLVVQKDKYWRLDVAAQTLPDDWTLKIDLLGVC